MCGMLGPYPVQSTPSTMAPSSIKLSPTHHSSGGSSSGGSTGTTVNTSEAAAASSYQNGYLGSASAVAAGSHSAYARDFLLRSREMSSFADFGAASAASFAATQADPFTGLHAAAADPAMAAYGMASAHQASAAAANQMYPSYMNGTAFDTSCPNFFVYQTQVFGDPIYIASLDNKHSSSSNIFLSINHKEIRLI